MKRVNIYITEKQDTELDHLCEILSAKSRSDIVRTAIDEYVEKYNQELKELMDGLSNSHSLLSDEAQTFKNECEKSPVFFVNNAIKIHTIDKGIIPFKLWRFQERLLEDVDLYKELIINKSRQCGFTDIICAYICQYLLFNENKNIAIFSHKQSNANHILSRIKQMIEYLPEFMKPSIKENIKSHMTFENGNMIIAGTSVSSVRGLNISLLFADEFAFMEPKMAEEFMYSIYPVIASSKTAKMIFGSNPNPINYEQTPFYKMWRDACYNENNLKPIEIPCHLVPGRDSKWAEYEKKMLGEERFVSEYECKFKYISYDTLHKPEIKKKYVFNKVVK